MVLALAVKSLRNRKLSAGLTLLSIALSAMLLLGVERLRHESRTSFASAVRSASRAARAARPTT